MKPPRLQDDGDPTVGESLASAIEAVGELVEVHIALAKAELAQEARSMALAVVPLLAALPLLVAGYLLLCMGAADALGAVIAPGAGYAIVGGVNVIGGAAAIRYALGRFRKRGKPEVTLASELAATARAVVPAVEGSSDEQ